MLQQWSYTRTSSRYQELSSSEKVLICECTDKFIGLVLFSGNSEGENRHNTGLRLDDPVFWLQGKWWCNWESARFCLWLVKKKKKFIHDAFHETNWGSLRRNIYIHVFYYYGRFMDPLTHGDYPLTMRSLVGSRLPAFTKEQSKMVEGSFDFIGINYYTSNYVLSLPLNNNVNKSYTTDSRTNSTCKSL